MNIKRLLSTVCATMLAVMLPVSSLASEGENYIPEEDTVITPSFITEVEEPKPLTPDGNLEMVDDVESKNNKEFYTVKTRNEEYFYLIIDKERTSDNVYFLNMVDETDLERIIAEECEEEENTLFTDPEPVVTEPEPDVVPEPVDDSTVTKTTPNTGVVFLLLAGIGAIVAVLYLKVIRKSLKADSSEEHEFMDEDQYEDDFFPPEPDEVTRYREVANQLDVIDLDEEDDDADLGIDPDEED